MERKLTRIYSLYYWNRFGGTETSFETDEEWFNASRDHGFNLSEEAFVKDFNEGLIDNEKFMLRIIDVPFPVYPETHFYGKEIYWAKIGGEYGWYYKDQLEAVQNLKKL